MQATYKTAISGIPVVAKTDDSITRISEAIAPCFSRHGCLPHFAVFGTTNHQHPVMDADDNDGGYRAIMDDHISPMEELPTKKQARRAMRFFAMPRADYDVNSTEGRREILAETEHYAQNKKHHFLGLCYAAGIKTKTYVSKGYCQGDMLDVVFARVHEGDGLLWRSKKAFKAECQQLDRYFWDGVFVLYDAADNCWSGGYIGDEDEALYKSAEENVKHLLDNYSAPRRYKITAPYATHSPAYAWRKIEHGATLSFDRNKKIVLYADSEEHALSIAQLWEGNAMVCDTLGSDTLGSDIGEPPISAHTGSGAQNGNADSISPRL